MLGRLMQLSVMRHVEAPDHYWAQVLASAIADDRLTFNQYRLVEHPYVEQWWERHWDFAEQLLDEPAFDHVRTCLLYTSPSPRDATLSRMPSSA